MQTNASHSCICQRSKMQSTSSNSIGITIILFLVQIGVRIPLIGFGFIDEDALIQYQCSNNFLHSGVIGFNYGETTSVCSSYVYLVFTSFVQYIFNDFFHSALALFNSFFLLLGIFLCSSSLCKVKQTIAGRPKRKHTIWVFLATGLSPIALEISTAGVQTSLLLFFTGILCFSLQNHHSLISRLAPIVLILLPFLNLASLIISVLYCFCLYFLNSHKKPEKLFSWLACLGGAASYFTFTFVYFGTPMTQDLIVNLHRAQESSFLNFVWSNFQNLYFNANAANLFNPFRAEATDFLAPVFLVLFGLSFIFILLRSGDFYISTLFLSALSLLIPLGYLIEAEPNKNLYGVSTILVFCIVCKGLLDFFEEERLLQSKKFRALLSCILAGFVFSQFFFSINSGSITKNFDSLLITNIQQLSPDPTDIMITKPGYAGFHLKHHVHDFKGLVEPKVSTSRRKNKKDWLQIYLNQEEIELIVLQQTESTPDPILKKLDQKWFDKNYELQRELDYYLYLDKRYSPYAKKLRMHRENFSYQIYQKRKKG